MTTELGPHPAGDSGPKAAAQKRGGLVGLVSIFIIFGVILMIVGIPMLAFDLDHSVSRNLSVAGLGLFFLILACGGFIWMDKTSEEARRAQLTRLLDSSKGEYFERLVNINVENLSAYYVTVKSHANKSFLTSLFVGVVGFIFIGIGMAQIMRGGTNAISVATLSGVSGVATEFISAVFFYLYNQTVRQMKEYHDSLLAVQNILLSFKLVGETHEPEKSKMIELMINYLVSHRPHETVPPVPALPQLPKRAQKAAEQPKQNGSAGALSA